MSFLLKITAGKNAGSEYTLHEGKNMIGRSRSSDVRVFNEDVSGKHFSIEISGGTATLQNISGYGTRVDGILVHQTMELCSGQVIEAGKSLKFIFEAPDGDDVQQVDNSDSELTQATKFIGDVPSDLQGLEQDSSEQTSVTKFADDVEQTSVTKFASDVLETSEEENIEETSVTKFASDLPEEHEDSTIEETSVTKFAADISDFNKDSEENSEQTSVTRFADSDSVEQTGITSADATSIGTVVSPQAGEDDNADSTVNETADYTGMTHLDRTADGSATRLEATTNDFFPSGTQYGDRTAAEDENLDEHGMFFDEDDLEDSEKTSSNETQIVQTRMASLEEINFIKNQIKKQQQSRLFFKFLIFSLFVVLLGVIWMLKSPPQEKVLTWPNRKEGKATIYLTKRVGAFEKGFQQGGFDIYYPGWEKAKVSAITPDIIEIRTFLGKDADVPLIISVQREISDEFIYENRVNALQNALRRLSERKNEQFNFDNSPTLEFLKPDARESENGIPVNKLAYQRDTGNSYFGILRFFRYERVNYIIRAEVPAEEKLRAFPILNSDTFVSINLMFVRKHWEGDDEYTKGDIKRAIVGVKDELQRNSPMQYPRLEREIKNILAQSMYEKNKSVYEEASSSLILLRARQQQWYNGQKIRWFSAVRENNKAEKMKVRNDCEAVFSVIGDKRRYDILRDHWE